MPSYIALTIDDLDNELKKQQPVLANYSDFTTRRTRCYSAALAAYQESLAEQDDIFVRADTYSSPISLGTAKVSTTVGDIYAVTLPTGARRVAGDSIMVEQGTSAVFVNVPRMSWDAIIASGASQTPYAFWEANGKVLVYVKDGGAFTSAASVNASFYRQLDATTTTGTALDIKQQDFANIVSATLQLMTQ